MTTDELLRRHLYVKHGRSFRECHPMDRSELEFLHDLYHEQSRYLHVQTSSHTNAT